MENETKDLILQIKEKHLGTLITNAKEIKAFVVKKLEEYTPEKYTGDAKAAAKDKAELNASAKQLNDARIALEKEWLMPFNSFKDEVAETVNLIKTASGKLDLIVKEKENEEKEAKKAVIQQMWNEEHFDLVSLDKVFNLRWLNKTTKITSIQTEIKDIITGIKKDLAALESFGEDTAQLKEIYLTTLNLQATLQKGAELRENRRRLEEMKVAEEERKAEEEKKSAEIKQVAEDLQNVTNEIVEQVKADIVKNPQEELKCPTAELKPEKWIFNCLCESERQYGVLKQISEKYGLEILPSITLKGSTQQIQDFKTELGEAGFSYDKKNFLTLEIKGE